LIVVGKDIKILVAALAYILTSFLPLDQMAVSVNPALWSAPIRKGRGGAGKKGASKEAPDTEVGKGKKRSHSQSGSRKGDTSASSTLAVGAPSGGYTVGNNTKPRLSLETHPWGTGAKADELELFTAGSEYPGIAKQLDNTPGSLPSVYEWIPCLNWDCTSPSRSKPPFPRAGASAYAVVSNPECKCKFCFVQFLPVNSQRIIEIFQKPLVAKLGGQLGALHPKFRGSKIYSHAELMLAANAANSDPTKPPLFDVGSSLFANAPLAGSASTSSAAPATTPMRSATVADWLSNNQLPKNISSAEAVRNAKSSLSRLEGAVANGEVNEFRIDFGALSRAASASSLHADANATQQVPNEAPNAGIYKFVASTASSEAENNPAKVAALNVMLKADFPEGEPLPPRPMPAELAQLSAPNELNILAGSSAQALRDLIAARSALEVCRDRVLACQNQLDEAKEMATKAAAEVKCSLDRYKEADTAVKDFNAKVAAKETERSSKIAEQVARVSQPTTPPVNSGQVKEEQGGTAAATYAAVAAKGTGNQASEQPIEPILPLPKRKDGDEQQDEQMSQPSNGSQNTSASKRVKKERDAQKMEMELANDASTAGELMHRPELSQDQVYYDKLSLVCQKYNVAVQTVIEAASRHENLILQLQEVQEENL